MKKILRKVITFFCDAKAKLRYDLAVKTAETRYGLEHNCIYIIERYNSPSKLAILSLKEFLSIRNQLGISSKQTPIRHLESRCYYHTQNKNGKNALSQKDKEFRRQAFIYNVRRNSKLLNKLH